MAIEFYPLSDIRHKEMILSVPEEKFILLEGVFEEFQQSTGVLIDTYGDSRIYPDHFQLLIKLLKEALTNNSIEAAGLDFAAQFISMMQRLLKEKEGLTIIGE